MRFLLFMWVVPWVWLVALFLLFDGDSGSPVVLLAGPPAVWVYANLPITAIYILVRIVRRAWGDGARRSSA